MQEETFQYEIRPDVINVNDLIEMVPALASHRKLAERLLHLVWMDRVNEVHGRWCASPGLEFSQALIDKEFKVNVKVDNEEILDRFPTGSFVTVSNHPFGALEGIALIYLVGRHRPDFKVMVNMFLNRLSAMQPSFIAVDNSGSNDPEKKKMTLKGIRTAIGRIRSGHPVGFFPAGAVSKVNAKMQLRDRQWQPSIVKLIQQAAVPVIPIYFHGHNSTFFNILGIIDWRLRTMRLPKELFRMRGRELHISVGEPIMPDELAKYPDTQLCGEMLRAKTYALRNE